MTKTQGWVLIALLIVGTLHVFGHDDWIINTVDAGVIAGIWLFKGALVVLAIILVVILFALFA